MSRDWRDGLYNHPSAFKEIMKKNNILFTCTLEDFHLVPYTRMTGRGKYVKENAKRYLSNQEALKWEFSTRYNGQFRYEGNVSLSFIVHYADKRIRDLSNCLKALEDSLQEIVIKNDSQIVELDKCRIVRDGRKRVAVTLKTILLKPA